jgi:hypothetical protein
VLARTAALWMKAAVESSLSARVPLGSQASFSEPNATIPYRVPVSSKTLLPCPKYLFWLKISFKPTYAS